MAPAAPRSSSSRLSSPSLTLTPPHTFAALCCAQRRPPHRYRASRRRGRPAPRRVVFLTRRGALRRDHTCSAPPPAPPTVSFASSAVSILPAPSPPGPGSPIHAPAYTEIDSVVNRCCDDFFPMCSADPSDILPPPDQRFWSAYGTLPRPSVSPL